MHIVKNPPVVSKAKKSVIDVLPIESRRGVPGERRNLHALASGRSSGVVLAGQTKVRRSSLSFSGRRRLDERVSIEGDAGLASSVSDVGRGVGERAPEHRVLDCFPLVGRDDDGHRSTVPGNQDVRSGRLDLGDERTQLLAGLGHADGLHAQNGSYINPRHVSRGGSRRRSGCWDRRTDRSPLQDVSHCLIGGHGS